MAEANSETPATTPAAGGATPESPATMLGGASGETQSAPGEQKPNGEGEVNKAAEDKPTIAPRAPEKYELKVADGALDMKEFSDLAKGIDLDNAGAQKLADIIVERGAQLIEKTKADTLATFNQERDARTGEWNKAIETDKRYAGDIKAAVQQAELPIRMAVEGGILSDAEKTDLAKAFDDTGIGSHPALFRLFNWLGSKLAQDTHVPTGGAPGQRDNSEAAKAQRLYPNQQ